MFPRYEDGGEEDGGEADDLLLISEGCPVPGNTANVSLSRGGGGRGGPSFSFRLTERHSALRRVYLACLIGLCSSSGGGGDLKVARCVDPARYCSAPRRSRPAHVAPVVQQLTRRGPLITLVGLGS